MCKTKTLLVLSCLYLAGWAQAQEPMPLESYDSPGYFMVSTSSGGAVQMVKDGDQSTAGQWNLIPGLANAEAVSFESVAIPNNIMRHRGYVFYTDPRAGDNLFMQDSTLFIRQGLADPTAVSFESINYPGQYLQHNSTFGLILAVPSDAGAATFRFPVLHGELARDPVPEDGEIDVPRDAGLGWTPGQFAATHDVYLGTRFDDVNTASRTTDPGHVLVSLGQDASTHDPTRLLDFGQTYYWRVDEVNAPDRPGLHKGETWSFTVEPYGYSITSIKATASSFNNTLTGPEKTIDGSGLDALDQHSTSATAMWLSKKSQTPVWIMYEFDAVYSLYQMWVWNQNQLSELDEGYGAMDVTVETSTDGTTWTALANVPQFAQAPAEDTYIHNTTVDFGGALAKFVRLNILSNWGDARFSGLSEVRFIYVPMKAFEPTPATGATGVSAEGVLNWRPGRTAVSHELYLGTDPNALSKLGSVTEHRYSLSAAGVEYDKTYYWKVNEINEAQSPTLWEGDVWSFSTAGSFVVDDFESYDDDCRRIFYTWVDGYGAGAPECGGSPITGNGTGAAVGKSGAPYAEKTILHGGKQSMPLFYDNPGATSISETTRTFAVGQDWVQGGAKTLVLASVHGR